MVWACEVTQFYRGAQILRGFDEEARGLIAEEMIQNGVNLHLGTNILEMAPVEGGYRVKATNGMEEVFEKVMFATGRVPNTGDMGLEDVGVPLGRKGEIVVDEYSQTAMPSIYAIGDVTDRVNLTPVAIREGMAFVETVFNGNPTPVDHDLIPTAIFTQPEMGTVGLSEEDAREQEPIEVYATSFRPMHDGVCRTGRPGADETDRLAGQPQGSGLSYRRTRRGRNDPAGGHRGQDGCHKRRFRPHGGGTPDHVGRTGHYEGSGADGLIFRSSCTG